MLTKCGFNDIDGFTGADLLVSHGPLLKVDIGYDYAYDPANPDYAPNLGATGIFARLDTGMAECSIDIDLAQRLGLHVVESRSVSGNDGQYVEDLYEAQVYVPSLAVTLSGRFTGRFLLENDSRVQAWIGRSLLQRFVMTYEGHTGTVTVSLV